MKWWLPVVVGLFVFLGLSGCVTRSPVPEGMVRIQAGGCGLKPKDYFVPKGMTLRELMVNSLSDQWLAESGDDAKSERSASGPAIAVSPFAGRVTLLRGEQALLRGFRLHPPFAELDEHVLRTGDRLHFAPVCLL